jgi:protoporphyrinogen oxidase
MAALADHVNPMSDSNTIVLPALTAASGDQQFMQWFVWLEDPLPPPPAPASHISLPPLLCWCPCQVACLTGLIQAKVDSATAAGSPANFDEWIMRVMGNGIADMFMRPYNFKV